MAAREEGVVLGQEVQPMETFRLVDISKGGLAMFWVVFGLMSVAAVIVWAVTLTKPRGHRANGFCSAILLTTAAFAYYAMAGKGGYAYVTVFQETRTARQVYYARYVDWFITTPLLLLDLLLLAGVSVADTIWIMIADVGMILAGLFGAILPSKYKWGWFAIGCVFMLFVFWGLVFHARKACMQRSKRLGAAYSGLAIYLIILWSAYPVCWGLAEGSNTISPQAEAYFYGTLDILAKVVFSLVILFLVEPIVTGVREKEHWVPSLLAAPVNGPLTGGDWQPGTAHENPMEHCRVAPDDAVVNGNKHPAAERPIVVEQPMAQRPVVPANSAQAPHLRTDPVV